MENKKPWLSLIVPCYNSANYLPECLDSIAGQKGVTDNIEIILVDDASVDDGRTISFLYEFQSKHPNTKVICHDTNKRQGGARNSGIDAATGEYVGFVDADDHLSLDYCEKLLSLTEETDADIIQFGHYQYVTDENDQMKIVGKEEWRPEVVRIDSDDIRKNFVMNGQMTLGHWNKIYRRKMLIEAGARFRENSYYEEPSFTYPLKYYVNKFAATDSCLNYNHLREDSGLHGGMKDATTINDHISQWLEIYDKMKKTEYYQDFSQEIDFSLIHSFVFETLVFCSQRKFRLDVLTFNKMKEEFLIRTGENYQNIYVSPGSFYNTLLDIMKINNMNQETLDEIIKILEDF